MIPLAQNCLLSFCIVSSIKMLCLIIQAFVKLLSDSLSHFLSRRGLRAAWNTRVGPWWCSRCSSSLLSFQCLLLAYIPFSLISVADHRQRKTLSITENDTPNVVPLIQNSTATTLLWMKTAAHPEAPSCPWLQITTGFSRNRKGKRRRMIQNCNKGGQ